MILPVPYDGPPILGVGAFLKSSVALLKAGEAHLVEDIGNLDSRPALERFEAAVAGFLKERPVAVAHDLHPDFPSTRHALSLGLPAIPVQHHHAHVAAAMAEHGLKEPVLGLAFDGYGMGWDGGSWGGELLKVAPEGCVRLGHLRPLALPGGDRAAREPWRMAAAALHALGRADEVPARFPDIPAARLIGQVLDRPGRTTTSGGRLFDAACGLLGIKPVAAFEGEAPMALEALAAAPAVLDGGWAVSEDGQLNLLPLLAALSGSGPQAGADLFHGTLVAALADWTGRAAEATGLRTILFSGGCFLNRLLRDGLRAALEARGLAVRAPNRLSPGDTAVSLGQAWVAAMKGV
ncbi:MAG: hydrogenase maturation protein HypF [Magnetospirillum sp. WYHS-4]